MIFQANGIQKQTEEVIFKHNKTYLSPKLKETKTKTKSYILLKRTNISRRYNNYKNMFTRHQHSLFYKTNTGGQESPNIMIEDDLSTSMFINSCVVKFPQNQ